MLGCGMMLGEVATGRFGFCLQINSIRWFLNPFGI